MLYKIYSIFYLLFSLTTIEEGLGICSQGTYLNLCGRCITHENESEGLDRCGICDGQSDCVGCDGIINSVRRTDTCGLCLSPQAENWNDCRKIDKIYPSFIDLSLDRDVVPVTITGVGLKQSIFNTSQCLLLPVESQSYNPEIKEMTVEENDIQLKIHLTESTGLYRITCSEIEGFVELQIADSRKLNVLNVNPAEVQVDEMVKFELEIEDTKGSNTNEKYWCFVKIQSGEIITLAATRKTGTHFTCNEYTPNEPGLAVIGIVANEEAAFYENGRTAVFTARAKSPIPESAEYSFDMQSIVVNFDQNIGMNGCDGTFSPETERSLGQSFTCTVAGDRLYLNLGNAPELIESLTIINTNSIRRAGPMEIKLSQNMNSIVLPVSREKVMPPSFTLIVPPTVCPNEESQPDVKLIVSKLGNQRLNYKWALLPMKEWKGKNQRENLLMWKNMRALEADLKNASVADDNIILSRKNLLPGLKYTINVSSTNSLNDRRDLTASLQVQQTQTSVIVKTFPSSSVIIAEANIILCRNQEKILLRYRWMIDNKVISEDGKILTVPQSKCGDYNVSCTVFDRETNQTLGGGWAVTQIVKIPGRVVIFPTEVVYGTMDDIVLQAYTDKTQFRWTCTTSLGEACIAVGPKAQSIDDLTDTMSSTVRIPAGTLPVGRYLWTLNGTENATATVIISHGIPPLINIVPLPLRIDSTKPFCLNADVERLKEGCKIRWKTMHRKGYSYFNLEYVGLGDLIQVRPDDLVTQEREVPLMIPKPQGKWKGLNGSEMYLFRLETVCPDPTPEAHSDVTLLVNGPPSSSDLTIIPDYGEAITTKFNIQITQGSDSIQDYPLMYTLSCQDDFNDEISLMTTPSTKYDVSLPPGNITVIVKTCDIWKSCSKSSKPVTVQELHNISSQTVENLEREIRNLILSGDTVEGYGKAIIAFKTLSKNGDSKETLLKVSSTAESAVKERIRDLSGRLKSDPKILKLCYEFLEQSVTSLKYFPESEGMIELLTQYKNFITKFSVVKRRKRDDSLHQKKPEISENLIRSVFELHSRKLEKSNLKSIPKEIITDVRKYMLELCMEDHRTSFLIDFPAIALRISKLTYQDMKKELPIADDKKAKLLLMNGTIKQGSCLATARYSKSKSPKPENLQTFVKLHDIFEIRLIQHGKIETTSITVTLPLPNTAFDQKCFVWSDEWNETCTVESKSDGVIRCRCNKSAYISTDQILERDVQTSVSETNKTVDLSGENMLDPEQEFAKTKKSEVSEEYGLISINYRSKRNSENELNDIVNEGTVKAIFDLHEKILEQNNDKNNREEFLADVRKYMIEICVYAQDCTKVSYLIESKLVTLEIKKLVQSNLKKEIPVAGIPDAQLKLNFKSLPKKTCTAIARYHNDFMENATSSRISDIYEVRFIKNGSFKNYFKDDFNSLTLTVPIYSNASLDVVNCMAWKNENGWQPYCVLKAKANSTVTCSCKDPGVFAVFSVNTTVSGTIISKAVTPTTPATNGIVNLTTTTVKTLLTSTQSLVNATVVPPTNSTYKFSPAESNKTDTTIISQYLTSTTSKTTTTKEGTIINSIKSLSDISKNASLIISGTFKINEDYNEVVGKNVTLFTESLKKQIPEQLELPIKAIYNIIVRPGSIIVSVLFIDTEEISAEDAVEKLALKLHEGTLRLTGYDAAVLDVQRQDLRVKIGSYPTRNTGKMRVITYGVLSGTCLAILLFVITATYFKRKRRRMSFRLPRLSIDDHPTYRQFHNEFSLDGSSASLARYRRDHPIETETTQ